MIQDQDKRSQGSSSEDEINEDLAKLPRAPLFGRPSMASVVRIGMFATLLYAIVVMRKPCSEGVGRFVSSFEEPAESDAEPSTSSGPTRSYQGYELMTTEEALKRFPAESNERVGDVGVVHDAGASGEASEPSQD